MNFYLFLPSNLNFFNFKNVFIPLQKRKNESHLLSICVHDFPSEINLTLNLINIKKMFCKNHKCVAHLHNLKSSFDPF
jgi:hypothetical protein